MNKNTTRPGYKKTRAGWIPVDWIVSNLGDQTMRIGDGIHTTPSYVERSKYYFVNGNNLLNGRVAILKQTKCVSRDEYLKHKQDLGPTTILLSINGTVGNLAYYRDDQIVLGKSAAYINCGNSLDTCFAFSILASDRAHSYFRSEWTGSTIKNLSLYTLRRMPIALPSVEEQRAIASVLSCWDRIIEHYQLKLEKKRNIKSGLMQRLLSGKQRLPGFIEIWRDMSLGDIGEFTKGKGITRAEVCNSGLSCIRYGEIYTTSDYVKTEFTSFIAQDRAQGSSRVRHNDLLLAGSGETLDEIGKSIAYMGHDEAYAGGDIIVLTPNEKIAQADYLAYYLNTIGRRALHRLGQGQSVVHLYAKNLATLLLSLPPIKEQHAIVTVLSAADKEITTLERKLTALKEQKRYLLNNLVTGAIRLPQFVGKG